MAPAQHEDEDDSFPSLGIQLSHLLTEFQLESFEGKTTAQVCEEFIKPLTKDQSYCDMLLKKGHTTVVSKAQVFISHSHGYLFLDVLSALEWHFLYFVRDVFFWMDLFSINQHVQFPSNGPLNG